MTKDAEHKHHDPLDPESDCAICGLIMARVLLNNSLDGLFAMESALASANRLLTALGAALEVHNAKKPRRRMNLSDAERKRRSQQGKTNAANRKAKQGAQ